MTSVVQPRLCVVESQAGRLCHLDYLAKSGESRLRWNFLDVNVRDRQIIEQYLQTGMTRRLDLERNGTGALSTTCRRRQIFRRIIVAFSHWIVQI